MKGTYLTYKAWLAAVRKAGAVRLDGDKDIATAFNSKGKGIGEWDGAEGYLYKGKSEVSENPKGIYTTYKSWLAAAKKAGAVRLDGDKDIAMAFDANGRGVAEWDGAEGYVYKRSMRENPVKPRKGEKTKAFISRCMSEEKKSFPAPKQRIAVCLSKSRARRNPYLESGADISDIKDINRKAASMA